MFSTGYSKSTLESFEPFTIWHWDSTSGPVVARRVSRLPHSPQRVTSHRRTWSSFSFRTRSLFPAVGLRGRWAEISIVCVGACSRHWERFVGSWDWTSWLQRREGKKNHGNKRESVFHLQDRGLNKQGVPTVSSIIRDFVYVHLFDRKDSPLQTR